MDERQQRQVNEAAEKFAHSLIEAYQTVGGGGGPGGWNPDNGTIPALGFNP
jgi:hypothetical protein